MNSKACEGEIIADGIFRTASGKGVCDLLCCLAVCGISRGQSQFSCQTVHVSVQRHDQAARGNGIPTAWVDIVFPDQPPEHQMKAFACTTPFRGWQEG